MKIGTTTTYNGTEHAYMNGFKVRIAGVIKGAASPAYDPDAGVGTLTDEADVERNGGVTKDDRVLVQPWLEREGRFSFVTSDARATDLACFGAR